MKTVVNQSACITNVYYNLTEGVWKKGAVLNKCEKKFCLDIDRLKRSAHKHCTLVVKFVSHSSKVQ